MADSVLSVRPLTPSVPPSRAKCRFSPLSCPGGRHRERISRNARDVPPCRMRAMLHERTRPPRRGTTCSRPQRTQAQGSGPPAPFGPRLPEPPRPHAQNNFAGLDPEGRTFRGPVSLPDSRDDASRSFEATGTAPRVGTPARQTRDLLGGGCRSRPRNNHKPRWTQFASSRFPPPTRPSASRYAIGGTGEITSLSLVVMKGLA